ncbi:MAG TPA: hypothetical protein VG267_15420 [Terracidiphilus sp.]|nr:hypothetical protein [Terracidiphilus sp.]
MAKSKEDWKYVNELGMTLAESIEPTIREVERSVEPFVTPLYKPKDFVSAPELIGTGVFLKIGASVFILTAAHVIEHFDPYPPLISHKDCFVPVPGESYRTKKPPSGTHRHDPTDASVMRIDGPIAEQLRDRCLTVEDLYISDVPKIEAYTVVGFPTRELEINGREYIHNPRSLTLFSGLEPEYKRIGSKRSVHIVFDPGKKLIHSKGTADIPNMKGMSGAGVWLVPRVMGSPQPHRLAGIFIEHRRTQRLMVATNVAVHLQLIAHYHSEFDDVFSASS